MKTTIFSLIITCFLFAACSDNDGLIPVVNDGTENVSGEEQELVPVSFQVDFAKEVTSLRASGSVFSLKYLEYYVFRVYNDGPVFIKNEKLVDFDGNFKDSLLSGNYQIVFVGYDSGTMSVSNIDSLMNSIGPTTIEFAEPSNCYEMSVTTEGWVEDQFYAKVDCYFVTDRLNEVVVTLERNVGKVEIVLDEVIPAEVSSITFDPYAYFSVYRFTPGSSDKDGGSLPLGPPMVSAKVIELSESDKLSKGFTISYLSYELMPYVAAGTSATDYPIVITSTYAGKEISKRIPIKVKKNTTRRYIGKFFEDFSGSAPFTLSLDETWDGEPIENHF